MPKFGLTMHEGTLQRQFRSQGETITAGAPLFEVETEKVMYEVEAPTSGIIALWRHEEGATIECGGLVAVIAEPGEDAAAVAARYGGPPTHARQGSATSDASTRASANGAASAVVSADQDASATASAGASVHAGASATAGGRQPVSPIARKLAAELDVELARVTGTGPGGRVTREDVERAAKAGASSTRSPATAAVASSAATTANGVVQTIPIRGVRRTIATRMHQSLRDTAQLTLTTEADVTAAVDLRERLKREYAFTFTDMLIHAAARALMRHPRMNSCATDEVITLLPAANVGVAVALDEGLIVPVIANASSKSLREIAALTKDLGERARTGNLKLEDVSGGTFTITNLGTWGVDAFTPILNSGETGILGAGRIVEKPAVYRGEITRRSMMTLSLTFDHRVIDGAPAAAFLQTVIDIFNYGDR